MLILKLSHSMVISSEGPCVSLSFAPRTSRIVATVVGFLKRTLTGNFRHLATLLLLQEDKFNIQTWTSGSNLPKPKAGGAGRQVLPFLLSDHQLLVQGGVSMENVMKRCLLSYLALLWSQNQGGGYMEETEDEEFLLSLRKMTWSRNNFWQVSIILRENYFFERGIGTSHLILGQGIHDPTCCSAWKTGGGGMGAYLPNIENTSKQLRKAGDRLYRGQLCWSPTPLGHGFLQQTFSMICDEEFFSILTRLPWELFIRKLRSLHCVAAMMTNHSGMARSCIFGSSFCTACLWTKINFLDKRVRT